MSSSCIMGIMWGENVTAHILYTNQIHVSVNDYLNFKENDMEDYANKDWLKKKRVKDYMSSYNREVTMSEYVTIPKARLRRLIITEVIAWGIAGFILIVGLFH